MPISSTGFTVETFDSRMARLRAAFEADAGITPDWDSDEEFISILFDVVGAELQTIAEAHQALWDAYAPNNASGRALENIAAIAGISRIPASRSRATVTLGGTPGTVVPAGKIIRHASTKTRWTLLEDVIVPGSGIVEAETTGPVSAAPGTLTEIVTPVGGWSSVTNADSAALGSVTESDARLRARRNAELARASTGTIPSISAAVLGVDGISGAKVVANDTGVTTTVGSFVLPHASIIVLVLPDPLTANEKSALAAAMLSVVPAGILTVGAESCSTALNGVTYSFAYDHATSSVVNVAVTISPKPGFTVADLEPEVENAITAYFGDLAIGGDVRLLPIWGALDNIAGVEAVTVLLNGVGADFTIADTEIATLGTITVL